MPIFNQDPKIEKGVEITEITSPEEIAADSPDGLYIQEGGTSTPSGGTTIHYYDSLEAAEAANLPEGSFYAVPSSGESGGGLPVVELTTSPSAEMTPLTAEECALMDEMAVKKMPFFLTWISSSGLICRALASVIYSPDGSMVGFMVETIMEILTINKEEVWQVISIDKD